MSRRDLPGGYRAVHRGERYVASGGGGDGVTLRREGDDASPSLVVPIDQLEQWFRVRTVCTYLGERFTVEAEFDDGTYWISFDGGDGQKIAAEWAARPGAGDGPSHWQEDRYRFMARVPASDVQDVRETRSDLLGPWRARHRGG